MLPWTTSEPVRRAARAPAVAGGSVRCGRCRHEHSPESWRRLEIVGRISADGVRGMVTAWPDGVVVEVRRCHACGTAMARTREC